MALHLHENGCYGVLIHNNRGMSDEELMKELEKYGKIKEMQKGGRNLIFAHFKEYEEAKACLNALCDDPDYSAKPARPRESRPSARGNAETRGRSLHRSDKNQRTNMNRCKSMTRLETIQKELKKKREEKKEEESSSSSTEGLNVTPKDKSLGVRFKLKSEENEKSDKKPTECSPSLHPTSTPKSSPVPPTSINPFVSNFRLKRMGMSEASSSLVSIQDYRDAHDLVSVTEKNGSRKMWDVLLANIPLWFMMGDVYELCSRFCRILHIDMNYSRDPKIIPFALVFVPSAKHAYHLAENLHGLMLNNKKLYCKVIQDLVTENPKYP